MTKNSEAITCPDCKMRYVPDIVEDFDLHKKYHYKMVNGVLARQLNSDNTIWQKHPYRITVVNHSSPKVQKKRAQEAGRLVLQDPFFSSLPYHSSEKPDDRNIHLFLLHHKSRVIGLLIVEKRSYIWKCTWKQYKNKQPEEVADPSPVWTIGLAWILLSHRGLGLARKLVSESVTFLESSADEVGWHPPFSDSGEALIRFFCPDAFYIAK